MDTIESMVLAWPALMGGQALGCAGFRACPGARLLVVQFDYRFIYFRLIGRHLQIGNSLRFANAKYRVVVPMYQVSVARYQKHIIKDQKTVISLLPHLKAFRRHCHITQVSKIISKSCLSAYHGRTSFRRPGRKQQAARVQFLPLCLRQ